MRLCQAASHAKLMYGGISYFTFLFCVFVVIHKTIMQNEASEFIEI